MSLYRTKQQFASDLEPSSVTSRYGERIFHVPDLVFPLALPAAVSPHQVRLKAEEISSLSELSQDYYARYFKLWIPEALEEYRRVMDACANGLAKCYARDKQWVEEEQGHLAFVEWGVTYYRLPSSLLTSLG